MTDTPFLCDMSARRPEQRARHHALAVELRPRILAFDELSEGYAARFATDPATVLRLAEFVTLERLCCPFFDLGITLARDDGPLLLTITGRDGVKPFIRAEFGIP